MFIVSAPPAEFGSSPSRHSVGQMMQPAAGSPLDVKSCLFAS